MSFVLKSRGVVPPGGMIVYRDPDDGWVYSHPYYVHVKATARLHRNQKGLPIPYNWDEIFDGIVCREVPAACREVPEAKEETRAGLREMAANFTRSALKWVREGFPTVSYDEFRRRYLICAGDEGHPRCSYFSHWPVFGVARCEKCGCAAGIKLKWATERCPAGKW